MSYLAHLKLACWLEEKLGFRNNSVLGSFQSYLKNILSEEISSKLKEKVSFLSWTYSTLSREERSQVIKEINQLLESFPLDGELFNKEVIKNTLFLENSVDKVKFVGKKVASELKKLKIETVEDLLSHYPYKYLDRRNLQSIGELKVGEEATVVGVVKDIRKKIIRKNLRILQIGIYDGTGYLFGIWFNQDYIGNILRVGTRVALSGKVDYRYRRLQMESPFYDVLKEAKDFEDEWLNTARIIPIYPATAQLSAGRLRRIVREALKQARVVDPLPLSLKLKQDFPNRNEALREIHFPSNEENLRKARNRLLFEELFYIQMALALRRKRIKEESKGIKHQVEGALLNKFLKNLSFDLTSDQKKVLAEIKKDMSSSRPMNRLLQGEVGSGKTVIAVTSMVIAVQSGYQVAMMVPTEVLAVQHEQRINNFLKGLGIKVSLLIGSLPLREKERVQKEISEGKIDVVLGTHALIQEGINFKNLGLVIIDEQHRFGLRQRIMLKEKGNRRDGKLERPDVLIMTATPIPRTFALTLYGDLDISTIRELPTNRDIYKQIETIVCDKKHRPWAYRKIREEVKKGRQAYIICPLIEESEKIEAKAVVKEAKRLKNDVFPDLRVGILHSKMKTQEKEKVMKDFRQGELDILISTTVIEVGIDIPNTTVMVIENADRFGLSQLHQLRGRIGRGKYKSYSILFSDPTTEEGKLRMEAIQKIKDGFKLAEEDLKIRGEGQIFGLRQSGLPDLKLAKLTRDLDVLIKAREEAFRIINEDPNLQSESNQLLLFEIRRKFAHSVDWLFHA